MVSVLVFMNHPNTVLHSSIIPLANSFFCDIMGFLGMGSDGSIGRATEFIARATARFTR